jgi:hypothetical protein
MGTDWLQLFDKRLCDEIVCLNTTALPGFVERHLDRFGEFSIFRAGSVDASAEDTIRRLLAEGETETTLRVALVDALCFSAKTVHLDYWGCYVEVFAGSDPRGSITDLTLFPEQQQDFLLLLPDHIDRILESLQVHRADLVVMTETDLNVIRQWRTECAADASKMVAYVFDA